MINLRLFPRSVTGFMSACWTVVRQTILLFPADWSLTYFLVSKVQTSTSLQKRLSVGHLVLTFSEIKYHPWQHRYLNQIARRVLSSNTENINGLFLFYAQTHCFSLPWSNVPGNLSTVLILLVCSYQDQICACERLMNEVLCLRKTSVKCCSLK